MPMIESTDLDESTIGGKPPKAKVGMLQFKKNLAFGCALNNESSRSARTASINNSRYSSIN